MSASSSQETYSPDQLVIGEALAEGITLLSGQNLTRGSVLGKKVTAGTIAGAAVAGGTGNGTIGSLTVGGAAKPGIYTAICTAAATNAGTFSIKDPALNHIGDATVAVAFVSTEDRKSVV